MQEGAYQYDAAPMDLERPLHYRREGKVDQVRGWKLRCLHPDFEGLKIISARKDEGREGVPVILKVFYFAESSRVVYSQGETKRLSSAWCK